MWLRMWDRFNRLFRGVHFERAVNRIAQSNGGGRATPQVGGNQHVRSGAVGKKQKRNANVLGGALAYGCPQGGYGSIGLLMILTSWSNGAELDERKLKKKRLACRAYEGRQLRRPTAVTTTKRRFRSG
jgi:hypothetical protein